ncbi:hypothetical protein M8756_13910 [Lutimaribacter sp. EGI FJ00015]|uniref:Uncharacterized protein n=1 Tax=Lutimaribacter degradans TaxID=2945989 RepID=A0ACC5ZY80_9RHOB|nr:hypothetical protein [Lutimaribacter sp. EGI FJ00013]MCM2563267.1 hypothetical protein [Lutimaribacter sp. EGI FJ00013]MCO0614410.1 hypothetical protein [Lutimaribacter sp. EGI FJ00015]MCO0635989.1 hypothetical protein [Lutimaribacter sp. EGI FJ00014]
MTSVFYHSYREKNSGYITMRQFFTTSTLTQKQANPLLPDWLKGQSKRYVQRLLPEVSHVKDVPKRRISTPAPTPANDRRELSARGQLPLGQAMLFADSSFATSDTRTWLEELYGLTVVNVHDRVGYHEWLLKCGKTSDLFIVDADSFESDQVLLGKFNEAVKRSFPLRPVILLSSDASINRFTPLPGAPGDVVLKKPVSRTSLWLGVKAAMDQHYAV